MALTKTHTITCVCVTKESQTDRDGMVEWLHGKVQLFGDGSVWICQPNCAALKEQVDRDARLAERCRLRDEEETKKQAFRATLEANYQTAGHPQANRLWEMAWEHGHSSGNALQRDGDVENYYSELCELLI